MGLLDTVLGDGQGGMDKKKMLMMGLMAMMYMKNKDNPNADGALGGLMGALGGLGGGQGGALGALGGLLGGGQGGGSPLGALGGLLGGGQQGGSGMGGLGALAGLAGALGGVGGLQSMMGKAGLGDQAASWIGTGSNQPVGVDQISQLLGNGPLSQLAQAAGVSEGEAAEFAAQNLPNIVDKLTPNGNAQDGQVDLMSLASQFLK